MFETFTKKTEQVPSFEEQWENPEKMTLSGEEVEVYDIKPEKEKTPVPVWLAPGWAATPEAFKDNIHTLANNSRRTISANAPHGIDFNRDEMPASDVEKMPDAEMRKIAAMINTIEAKGVEKVDAIGHSEGCMDTILAAMLYPEKFRNIVLVNPAGMIGKDSLPRLMVGFSTDIVKGHIDEIRKNGFSKPLVRMGRELGRSIISDPVNSFKEVLAISNAEIHDMLIELRKKDIKIAVVSAVDDDAFPTERMQGIMKPEMYDGFYTVRGKHNQFVLEAGIYTELCESALLGLQARREREELEASGANK